MRKVTAVVCGAGGRGRFAYGPYALKHPEEIQIVAVAEPDKVKREKFSEEHGIPKERQFRDWKDLLHQGKIADGAIITMMDKLHLEPSIRFMKAGYDILLEKPMDTSLEGSVQIAQTAQELGRKVLVAHVLRYTRFFQKLKEIINKGVIGRLMAIEHKENIGYYHMAHSFVRGNWRSEREAAPLILAKSCHDLDILYWLIGEKCVEVCSFGFLSHFVPANQPAGAADRCVDCKVESECPYSAVKIYPEDKTTWPVTAITTDLSPEGIREAVRTGPYGRCVYTCDNDVVDHQVVSMRFGNDVLVNFTLTAFTHDISRTMRVFGTMGEIRGHFTKNEIEVIPFGKEPYIVRADAGDSGHGGGDDGLMREFVQMIASGSAPNASAMDSLESHLIAFAAEESRLRGAVVRMDEFRKRCKEVPQVL